MVVFRPKMESVSDPGSVRRSTKVRMGAGSCSFEYDDTG